MATTAAPLFTPPPPPTSTKPLTFYLRPAHPSDAEAMASLAATSYLHAPFTRLLSPLRYTFLSDYMRGYRVRILQRLVARKCISVVAIAPQPFPHVIGYALFERQGGPAVLPEQDTWAMRLWWRPLTWVSGLWRRPNRSEDLDMVAAFSAEQIGYWEGEEWADMWRTASVVVSVAWQRRGVGRRMMGVVVERAQAEGLKIGLEASPEGEGMYRSVGFRKIRDFKTKIEGEDGGGVMVWEPEKEVEEEVEEDEEEVVVEG